jgi:hypothetical protein
MPWGYNCICCPAQEDNYICKTQAQKLHLFLCLQAQINILIGLQLLQCVHSLTHLADETLRCGPLSGCAQWCMESAIGSFGREVRSHSKTFANIANRGVLRAQINAIKAKIPNLEPDPTLPRGSFSFGDGYALLHATDSTRRPVTDREATAIRASGVVDASIPPIGAVEVCRWARLLLPNGQVARCAWKETSRGEKVVRRARNVKVCLSPIDTCFYF